jgi:hypothetical protein
VDPQAGLPFEPLIPGSGKTAKSQSAHARKGPNLRSAGVKSAEEFPISDVDWAASIGGVSVPGASAGAAPTADATTPTETPKKGYNLKYNPWSWNEAAHMLFVEQPIRYDDKLCTVNLVLSDCNWSRVYVTVKRSFSHFVSRLYVCTMCVCSDIPMCLFVRRTGYSKAAMGAQEITNEDQVGDDFYGFMQSFLTVRDVVVKGCGNCSMVIVDIHA